MTIIQETIGNLDVGDPQHFANLTLFPLLSDRKVDADYLTLGEALEKEQVEISEVSDSGSVPELLFKNGSDKDVLLLDGEGLAGAKQNRVLNITILVAAGKTIVIPVSCVEQGRWSYRSGKFRESGRVMYSRGRREKMAQVSGMLKQYGTRNADQGQIWASISDRAVGFDVQSETESLDDIYDSQAETLDRYCQAFKAEKNQAGGVFCIDGKIVGMELFDKPDTFRKLSNKLVESYAMDAIETQGQAITSNRQVANVVQFLSDTVSAKVERFDALGEGEDLRLSADSVVGGGLEAQGRLVQLSVFRVDDSIGGSGTRRGSHVFHHHRGFRRAA